MNDFSSMIRKSPEIMLIAITIFRGIVFVTLIDYL